MEIIIFVVIIGVILFIKSSLQDHNDKLREQAFRSDFIQRFEAAGLRFLAVNKVIQSYQSKEDAQKAVAEFEGEWNIFEVHSNGNLSHAFYIVKGDVLNHRTMLMRYLMDFTSANCFRKDWQIEVIRHKESDSVRESRETKERIRSEEIDSLKKQRTKERAKISDLRRKDVFSREKEDLSDDAVAVYVIGAASFFKVGISKDPNSRLAELKTGNPFKDMSILKLFWFVDRSDALYVEGELHKKLTQIGAHSSGEWFEGASSEIINVIEKHIKSLVTKNKVKHTVAQVLDVSELSAIENKLLELGVVEWQTSAKGNKYIRVGSKTLTIFAKKNGWGYVYDNRFSRNRYSSFDEAKVEALREHGSKIKLN